MPLPQKPSYTSIDYWSLPDRQRAELINGKLYAMALPDFLHQKPVMELSGTIRKYWIVDPRTEKITVYYLEVSDPVIDTYTFQSRIKVNIYDDLWIDFKDLDL